MRIVISLVTFAFAALSGIAALIQIKKKDGGRSAGYLMFSGAAGLLAALCLKWMVLSAGTVDAKWTALSAVAVVGAVIGCALICVAALLNGKRNGVIHWQHHAVRLCVAALAVIGIALM